LLLWWLSKKNNCFWKLLGWELVAAAALVAATNGLRTCTLHDDCLRRGPRLIQINLLASRFSTAGS